jgi:hypothetical protein
MYGLLARIWEEHRYQSGDQREAGAIGDDPLRRWANHAVIGLAAASVVLFLYEEISQDPSLWISTTNLAIDVLFLCDYLLRVIFAGIVLSRPTKENVARWRFSVAKQNYVIRWYGIVDFIAVAPPLLYHAVHWGVVIEEFSRAARLLRLLRLARILRIVKTVRFVRETQAARSRLIQHHRKIGVEVKASLVAVAIVVIGSSVLLHLLDQQNPDFGDLGNSVYFTLLSLSGQGTPSDLHTLSTRLIGMVTIFAGLALVGIVTGSFTSLLMERVRTHTSGNQPYHGAGHLVICGYSHLLPEVLKKLADKNEEREVVLLFDRGKEREEFLEEQEYPCASLGRPLALHWVRGKCLDGEALLRANAQNASNVLILASDGGVNDPDNDGHEHQEKDEATNAHALLTLIQLRWLMRASENGASVSNEHAKAPARTKSPSQTYVWDRRYESGQQVSVTVEYVGTRKPPEAEVDPDIVVDFVHRDRELSSALLSKVWIGENEHLPSIVICGMHMGAMPFLEMLMQDRRHGTVSVVCRHTANMSAALEKMGAKLVEGSAFDTESLNETEIQHASCVVILARDSADTESDMDALTLQMLMTVLSSNVNPSARIVVQVFQEPVEQWIGAYRKSDMTFVPVHTDELLAESLVGRMA